MTTLPEKDLESRQSETDLVRRAQAGDVDAFERLASPYADRLYAVVRRLVVDPRDAEDVVQETLLRAWRGIGSFRGGSMFFTWLYRIGVNESNRVLKKRSRPDQSPLGEDEVPEIAAPAHEGPAGQAEQQELREALDDAIAELAPNYRTALVLRDIEGLSTRDAARIVGIGEGAFKSRLHQARMKLRATLGDAQLIGAS